MSAETAKQIIDGFGRLLQLQYYDEATDSYKPGGNPGGGGGGGAGSATAANQLKTIGPVAPGTAASNSELVGAVYPATDYSLTPGQQAAFRLDSKGYLVMTLGTKLAGENTSRNYLEVRSGQGDRWPAEAGTTTTLGTVGATGDFLERLDVTVTDSSKSGIVLIDGTVAAVLSLTTNDTTASTTTVINTAVNPAAVSADQFLGSLLKIGTEYRRIGSHPAFAAGAVNQYTVTRAFSTAPGLSAAFTIEDKRYTFQIASSGVLVSGQRLPVQYLAKQGALRLIPEAGVHCAAFGDFT